MQGYAFARKPLLACGMPADIAFAIRPETTVWAPGTAPLPPKPRTVPPRGRRTGAVGGLNAAYGHGITSAEVSGPR